MDGMNSLYRYFKNNFADGFRQDSIDLFLGNYQVEESEGLSKPSPLQSDRDWKFYAVSYGFHLRLTSQLIILILFENLFMPVAFMTNIMPKRLEIFFFVNGTV